MLRQPNWTMVAAIVLWLVSRQTGWNLPAYPVGTWYFNPFAWQVLFIFGAWCALGGAQRMSRILSSNLTLWICIGYLFFGFVIAMIWNFPAQLGHLMPKWLENWMYPVNKTDLDVIRFAHFLALAAITVRFLPKHWPPLRSAWLRPLILCGQHSLEIFCLGIFLAFAGHFVLAEVSGGAVMQVLVSLAGILIMCGMAWVISWYKRSADKDAKKGIGNADMAGGSL